MKGRDFVAAHGKFKLRLSGRTLLVGLCLLLLLVWVLLRAVPIVTEEAFPLEEAVVEAIVGS